MTTVAHDLIVLVAVFGWIALQTLAMVAVAATGKDRT